MKIRVELHSHTQYSHIWNVLKGEMSLVGPRPPLPREVEQYTEYDKQRLFVLLGNRFLAN